MPEQPTTSPDVALRKFLDAVADEAETNTAFRNRLLQAIGVKIVFEGAEDIATADPVVLSVLHSEDAFRRIYGILKAAELKKMLVDRQLATKDDVAPSKKQKAPELLGLLWSRARERAEEDGKI